jgi:hypothetical protein
MGEPAPFHAFLPGVITRDFCYSETVRGKLVIGLFFAFLGYAQQQNQQSGSRSTQAAPKQQSQQPQNQPQQPPQQSAKPAPLFGGQLNVKSSDRSKESATLGFNGIDPDGKVDAKMLSTNASAADAAKVQGMDANRPSGDQLDAFLQEGGLKKK